MSKGECVLDRYTDMAAGDYQWSPHYQQMHLKTLPAGVCKRSGISFNRIDFVLGVQ